MAKSILHLQEILVVAQDPRAGNLLRSGVGSQQIEAVADLLGLDHLDPAAPLQLTVWVHGIVKVFMGFEPLQRASHLASQFLRVHLFALDRRQPLEFVLCFSSTVPAAWWYRRGCRARPPNAAAGPGRRWLPPAGLAADPSDGPGYAHTD